MKDRISFEHSETKKSNVNGHFKGPSFSPLQIVVFENTILFRIKRDFRFKLNYKRYSKILRENI